MSKIDTWTVFKLEYGLGVYQNNTLVEYNDNHDEGLAALPQDIPIILKVKYGYDSKLQDYVGDNSEFPSTLKEALELYVRLSDE